MAIRNLEILGNGSGRIDTIRFSFGEHHFVEVTDNEKCTQFIVGATHHGIRADATGVPSELEGFTEELRMAHPEHRID